MYVNFLIKNISLFLKKNFYLIILLLIFLSITNFFFNIYALSLRDYNERMLRAYNYCGGVSYGFIKKITQKYSNIKKIYTINFELNPLSYGLFHNLNIDKSKSNLILLNFNPEKKEILEREKINLKQYQLIEKDNNCFFYKKI